MNEQQNHNPNENIIQINSLNRKAIVNEFCHYQMKQKIGICKICFSVIEFRTNPVIPIFKHIKDEHPEQLKDFKDNRVKKFGDEPNINPAVEKNQKVTPIQMHFEYHASSQALCRMCGKIFKINANSSKVLQNHLRLKHSQTVSQNNSTNQLNIRFDQSEITQKKLYQNNDDSSQEDSFSSDSSQSVQEKKNKAINRRNSKLHSLNKKQPNLSNLGENQQISHNNLQIKQYFAFQDQNNRFMCKICGQTGFKKNQSAQKLAQHLQNVHGFKDNQPPVQNNSQNASIMPQKSRNLNSFQKLAWEYFIKQPENGKVTCKQCGMQKSYTHGGSISSLLKHIKAKHEDFEIDGWMEDQNYPVMKQKQIFHPQESNGVQKFKQSKNMEFNYQVKTDQRKTKGRKIKQIEIQSLKDLQMKYLLGESSRQNKSKESQQNFLVDSKQGFALCQICECIFSMKNYHLKKFTHHIKNVHNQKIENSKINYNASINLNTVFEYKKNSLNNISEINKKQFQNHKHKINNFSKKKEQTFLEVNHSLSEEKQDEAVAQNHIEELIIEQGVLKISIELEDLYGGCKDEYLQYLSILKNHYSFKILHFSKGTSLKFFAFIKNFPKEDKVIYEKQISFWQYQNSFIDKKPYSIIYICAHQRNIQPILLGICLAPIENCPNFQFFLNIFFQTIDFLPFQILISGSNKFKKACQNLIKSVRKEQKLGKQPKKKMQIIQIWDNIFNCANEDDQFSSILYDNLMALCRKEQQTNSQIFLGFTLTFKYFKQLKKMIPSNLEPHKKMDQLLYSCTQYLRNPYNIGEEDQTNALLNEAVIESSISCQQMKYLQKSLSHDIFLKLCYCYLYANLRLKMTEKQQWLYLVSEQGDDFNGKVTQYYVSCDLQTKYWKCDCALKSLAGLPCSHIIKILIYYNNSISPYIDECWILSSQSMMNLMDNQRGLKLKADPNPLIAHFLKDNFKDMESFNKLFWS